MLELFEKTFDILFPPSEDELLVRRASREDALACLAPVYKEGAYALSQFKRTLVRTLIHEAKFHYNRKAIRLLAEMLERHLRDHPIPEGALVIPIPLSKQRLRERGYNQVSEILSTADIPINERLLLRAKETRPQTELSGEERRKNIAGAFLVSRPELIAGRHVVLVDDVLTTGATMSAAKVELSRHKPASITCIALAH